MRESQKYVLEVLRHKGPMTDEGIFGCLTAMGYPISESGARTRRSELERLGFVVKSGRKARLSTGNFGVVWAAR